MECWWEYCFHNFYHHLEEYGLMWEETNVHKLFHHCSHISLLLCEMKCYPIAWWENYKVANNKLLWLLLLLLLYDVPLWLLMLSTTTTYSCQNTVQVDRDDIFRYFRRFEGCRLDCVQIMWGCCLWLCWWCLCWCLVFVVTLFWLLWFG